MALLFNEYLFISQVLAKNMNSNLLLPTSTACSAEGISSHMEWLEGFPA
jgi:hypothetical protein